MRSTVAPAFGYLTCLAIEIDTFLTSSRLVRVFEQLADQRSLPSVLRMDNGPEFLGADFTSWCADPGIFIDYIEPGKPNHLGTPLRGETPIWKDSIAPIEQKC